MLCLMCTDKFVFRIQNTSTPHLKEYRELIESKNYSIDIKFVAMLEILVLTF